MSENDATVVQEVIKAAANDLRWSLHYFITHCLNRLGWPSAEPASPNPNVNEIIAEPGSPWKPSKHPYISDLSKPLTFVGSLKIGSRVLARQAHDPSVEVPVKYWFEGDVLKLVVGTQPSINIGDKTCVKLVCDALETYV